MRAPAPRRSSTSHAARPITRRTPSSSADHRGHRPLVEPGGAGAAAARLRRPGARLLRRVPRRPRRPSTVPRVRWRRANDGWQTRRRGRRRGGAADPTWARPARAGDAPLASWRSSQRRPESPPGRTTRTTSCPRPSPTRSPSCTTTPTSAGRERADVLAFTRAPLDAPLDLAGPVSRAPRRGATGPASTCTPGCSTSRPTARASTIVRGQSLGRPARTRPPLSRSATPATAAPGPSSAPARWRPATSRSRAEPGHGENPWWAVDTERNELELRVGGDRSYVAVTVLDSVA